MHLSDIKNTVNTYCSKIGQDPLLVQGAGGNVSWKEEGLLWVKASGMRLADASEKNIFVCVDLSQVIATLSKEDSESSPKVLHGYPLRPSIETLLHGLMQHKIVLHLHAVEILAHMVRYENDAELSLLIGKSIDWILVDYNKPGAELAKDIYNKIIEKPATKVIFLKNHGVVIGGEDISEVDQILNELVFRLKTKPINLPSILSLSFTPPLDFMSEYFPIDDIDIHQLAVNPHLYNQLAINWALYPDHVVFLGSKAYTYLTWGFLKKRKENYNESPELIFVKGKGVFIKSSFSKAKREQLRCYFDVIVRQENFSKLRTLTNKQVGNLLNWDAERFRVNLSET